MTFPSTQDVVQWQDFASIIIIPFAQPPDRTTKECITEPIRFYHLFSDDGFDVSDVPHVNEDCMCRIKNSSVFVFIK